MLSPRVPRASTWVLAALLALASLDAHSEDAEPAGGLMAENRLAQERSPYLRQHRHNPVDWYPWGDEALERARRENRPIFLSVGYAACHWCHVMEHESFEDEETARLLNATFVCVKVDREERPDIDALYMRAVHLIAGRGGWPMTTILTPDGDPFFAATYLPRESLQRLTQRVGKLWTENEAGLRQQAEVVAERLVDLSDGRELPAFDGTDPELLRIVENALAVGFDRAHGGYGDAPKFPPHAELLYLLDRAVRDDVPDVLEQVLKTLDAMAAGGVHDQVGGGFHRYSTDDVWLVPHFEKMLYDNALLAQAFALAFAATGRSHYADAARGILEWVVREMARPAGGYASSLDADTEGEEGLTYTWTPEELQEALSKAEADLAARVFGVTADGNFRDEATRRGTGRNILHLPAALADVAKREDTTEEALGLRVDEIRTALRVVRDRRPQPGLDDKVITAWNGLLLSAFARCGTALSAEGWLEAGRKLATYLLEHCRREDGVLLRFPRDSGPELVGFCDDHVHLAEGLLDLAEATGEERWSRAARVIGDATLEMFEDTAAGGFFSTSETHHESLLARQKETYDSPIPSENGTAARLFLRLAALTSEPRYRAAADRTLAAWRPLMGWSRSAIGTVALYRALALRLVDSDGLDFVAGDAAATAPSIEAAAFLEHDQVQPGARTRVAIRVVVEKGWHVQAAPSVESEAFSVTSLEAASKSPIRLEDIEYPPPAALETDAESLPILEGTFWIRGSVAVPADAPLGVQKVVLLLTLQPCSDTSCLAPATLEFELPLRFAKETGPARHVDVFEP